MTPKKRAKRPAAKKASPEKYRTSGESGQPPRPLVAGPRKKRLSGPPAPRLSNHKARAVWFQARASWPVREAPVHALLRARAAAQRKPQAPIAAEWHCAGPTNIAGRITSLVCHPGDVNKLWAGSAGGVWQSADGGQTWSSLWHAQDILCIGALALDPGNPDIIYCGTGEANLSADSYSGVGLFQSKDAGANWHILADSAATGIPRRIGAIAVDPFDPSHLRLGGVGFKEASASNDLGGLYASHDGGVTWIREEFVSSGNYWCHAVIFHPAKRDCLYATVTEQGTKSGIWRSQDGGQTWKHLTAGLPDSASFGRTSLAISPSFPDILYAFAQDEASGNSDLLLGVFRSDDGGNTWSDISGSEFADENQISYGNSIAVHPTDVDTVICGGVDLHLTQDGGKSWTQVTHWDANRGDANYAHADHHALLMPAAQPGLIYSGNDGGVDLSRDTGTTWQNRSNGLAVTMYYDIDVCQSDSRNFGGGAQDNGTLVTTTGSADDHREILGGDGGWMVYDPADPRHLYGSFYNMGMYRFRDGRPTDVSPPVPENSSIWMCYITLDPKDANVVYTGSTRVWKTTDDAQSWNPVSPSLDDSPISAIEVAPADSQRIYAGTENGGFFRSTDAGQTWSPNLSSSVLPGHTITRLESSGKGGADLLYATVANFGHAHVFRSRDGGLNWEDIDKGQLPDVPHHAIVVVPDTPVVIYVCNDVGVFTSNDAGSTWTNMTGTLPNVSVVDLVYVASEQTLYAATYGRSIWKIKTAEAG